VTDFGRINLVFANAGVCIGGKIIDTDPKEFDWMMDVNIRGVFTTIQAFVPGLIEAAEKGQSAHFIFTGSENSLGVPPGAAASCYTATKHGVLGLADTLRRDLADTKVGVSILCPGMVDTRIWDARRTRHDRYGGTAAMPPEFAAVASKVVALGQKPELTAELCLEGVERRDFIITTDPKIRSFSSTRHREVDASLDLLDARLALKESVQ